MSPLTPRPGYCNLLLGHLPGLISVGDLFSALTNYLLEDLAWRRNFTM